jgi:hypothetical protein
MDIIIMLMSNNWFYLFFLACFAGLAVWIGLNE